MKAKKISALLLAAAMTACAVPAQGAAADEPKVPKYIFLFIGDGNELSSGSDNKLLSECN